jgi:hypothetical protein
MTRKHAEPEELTLHMSSPSLILAPTRPTVSKVNGSSLITEILNDRESNPGKVGTVTAK